jgi:hypothetical protein
MPMYDGVVTIAEDDIPVVVELDDTRVRMSAAGTEIGDWRADECRIAHVADSTYTISAENETIRFVPSQPTLFAAAVNGGSPRSVLSSPEAETKALVNGPDRPQTEVRTTAPSPETEIEVLITAPASGAEPDAIELEPEKAEVVVGDGEAIAPAREAPPPRPVTLALFYVLCALTAGLAVWSLISMVL